MMNLLPIAMLRGLSSIEIHVIPSINIIIMYLPPIRLLEMLGGLSSIEIKN